MNRTGKAPLIFGSMQPMVVGSIVRQTFSDSLREEREPQPFLIVREATYDEYLDSVVACGGDASDLPPIPGSYYYEVLTD